MRRTCPFLLGALLVALICLGGGPHRLDELLAGLTAWTAGWLPADLASHQPAGRGHQPGQKLSAEPAVPEDSGACAAHCRARRTAWCSRSQKSALTSNPPRGLETLQRLAGQRCQLSLDDFGTGSLSLAFLRKLPIHELKIDRSFVLAMRGDADAAAVVRSTISLGKSLDLRVVAEGVEDAATLDELHRLRCDEVQGFLVGPPMTADAFASWPQQGGHDRAPDTAAGAQEPLSAA